MIDTLIIYILKIGSEEGKVGRCRQIRTDLTNSIVCKISFLPSIRVTWVTEINNRINSQNYFSHIQITSYAKDILFMKYVYKFL